MKVDFPVLILVEDSTRGTPLPRLLPYVLKELRHGGHILPLITGETAGAGGG